GGGRARGWVSQSCARSRRSTAEPCAPRTLRAAEPSSFSISRPPSPSVFGRRKGTEKAQVRGEKGAWSCQVQRVDRETVPMGPTRGPPPDPDPPLNAQLAELAASQHGVVTAKQLEMTSSSISKRVRAGTLHRVHRGVYAVGHERLS